MLVLNIAGGKFNHLPILESEKSPYFTSFEINVDTGHYTDTIPQGIESEATSWISDPDHVSKVRYLREDAFRFMERTVLKFDRVAIYRFLEHVTFTQVLYFIYLVSTVTKKGGLVDVIVPNYEILCENILAEKNVFEPSDSKVNTYKIFENHNIQVTTELLNEPSCPHASIWTPFRAQLFWELEKRFRIDDIDAFFKFDGRDIYMRFIAERL